MLGNSVPIIHYTHYTHTCLWRVLSPCQLAAAAAAKWPIYRPDCRSAIRHPLTHWPLRIRHTFGEEAGEMLRLQLPVVELPRFPFPLPPVFLCRQITASGVNLTQFKWKISAFIYWICIAAHAGRENERCSYKISYLSRYLNMTFVWLQQQDMDIAPICSRAELNNVCDSRDWERASTSRKDLSGPAEH